MKILYQTRQKIGCKILQRKAQRVKRTKSYHNINSAITVGVLFDSTVQADYFSARRFISYLIEAGKNVTAIGMVLNEEMLRYYTPYQYVKLFSLEKVNLFGIPTSQEVNQFVNTDFDILINICTIENLCIDYIMGMSIAKFKVSMKYQKFDFADFALEFKDGRKPETDNLINTIKQYLSALSKKS